MPRKKALYAVVFSFILINSGLWAGDTALFVDLGFSPDGKIYTFAQYGVESKTLRPWADLFVVDVPRNNFVSGGRLNFVHHSPVVTGQDGSGAVYRIIADNSALLSKYGISFLNHGQPLYIGVDSGVQEKGQGIEFRNFDEGSSYKANLVQYVEGSGASLKSSFYINVEKTARDGAKTAYTAGTPQLKRPLISSYKIVRVLTGPRGGAARPKGDALIFVVETEYHSPDGITIRYMVEALSLP
jgi:predicted secreted protein